MVPAGRYAPSPSGDLHVGNLRTAVLAWLFARSTGRDFALRVDDLDRVRPGSAERQLADLQALGLDWDGPVLWQSTRAAAHREAVRSLIDAGRTFECFCSRREVLEAPTAPHHPPGSYPGTCRDLSSAERAERRRDRPAAIRLRSEVDAWTVHDLLHGSVTGPVDDLVLQRGDGVVAYNLTVVLDDAHQGVDQVVRGGDLLPSTPRQAYLATLLDLTVPHYAHVPLAVNTDGARLAKRDGAVTLAELTDRGIDPVALIGGSLGFTGTGPREWLAEFDSARLPREPWVVVPPDAPASRTAQHGR